VVVCLGGVLRYEQQVRNLLLDKIEVSPDIVFVDVQLRRSPEETLDLRDALNALEQLQIMNWLQKA
jgi:hypothetical protein